LFEPGDIVGFKSFTASKHKWHLCINVSGGFLFLNSPKDRVYPGDLEIDCAAVDGVAPTETGKSIISCNAVIRMTARQLDLCGAKRVGCLRKEELMELRDHAEASRVLSIEDKRIIREGLKDL
jgi:hypothetical protein